LPYDQYRGIRHPIPLLTPVCIQADHVPAFNILPHPAKSNNPADLTQNPGETGGLQSAGQAGIFGAKGPHVPSKDVAEGLEKPKSREEVCTFAMPFKGGPGLH
jgi:hypothetical protein